MKSVWSGSNCPDVLGGEHYAQPVLSQAMRRVLPLIASLNFGFFVGACGSTPAMPKGPPPEYEDNPTAVPVPTMTAPPAVPPTPPTEGGPSSAPDSGQAPK